MENAEKVKTPAQEEKEIEKLKAKNYDLESQMRILQKQLDAAQEEKRKPGITVVEEDGTQNKRKRPNTWGLTDLILPPYVKKRVAIYRICAMDETNPATGLKVEPYDVHIPGRYIIEDKYERDPMKRRKVIENIIGTERYVEDGQQKTRDQVADIEFRRGWLQVPIESSYPLHVVCELHPNNKTNKHRPHNAPVLFERVDISYKSAASQGAALELSLAAGNAVRDMKKDDVLSFAASVDTIVASAGRSVAEIKTDLMRWAMNNPIPFYKLNKNAKAAVQINILDAMNFGLIGHRFDKKAYVNMETDEIICNYTAAEEPMDALVKFLSASDGRGAEWYKNLMERMSYWEITD